MLCSDGVSVGSYFLKGWSVVKFKGAQFQGYVKSGLYPYSVGQGGVIWIKNDEVLVLVIDFYYF
jgi:hypothetical protein